jgi:hypothetical protein
MPTTITTDELKKLVETKEPFCTECGMTRSKHHYRHPFRPSHTTTIETMAYDLACEVIEFREAAQEVVDEYPVAAGTKKFFALEKKGYGSIRNLQILLKQIKRPKEQQI